MVRLTLNCPTCRKWLVYIPLDGLTLHFRCEEHGLWIFKPLLCVEPEEHSCERSTHDAA
jgi:hypothetical protein